MKALHTALNVQPNLQQAKNVILFLGDGMGIPTVTATRILKGQLAGQSGEETSLVMDTFPHLALSKVSLLSLTHSGCYVYLHFLNECKMHALVVKLS
ncbi:Intestinal-type alkaline phosphatase [Liparis tanakae]|uniref:alkaline phosphatase n=1 Tax=Liparis tanakae TaxID=230148 RepID=A0A4Z2EMX5_9TELE|nr:Intestinal-type alkaline phosphatase [Liparis tanakae]